MNEFEKYLFDLRDFIVARNAITTAQIDGLSTRMEMHLTEQNHIFGSDRTRFNTDEDLAGPPHHCWNGMAVIQN